MKRFNVRLALAILLTLATLDNAYAQTARNTHRTSRPVASHVTESAPNGDPHVFYWRHYGVNKLVPDEYIPAPAGVDPTDKTQIVNIVTSSAKYEKGNTKLREGMAGSFFCSVAADLPDYFWTEVLRQVRDGKIHRKVVHHLESAGDFPMASGSKLDAKGNSVTYIEGDRVENRTGGDIYGWELDEAIPITNGCHKGLAVRPIIYEVCRNVDGFIGNPPEAPVQAVVAPLVTPAPPVAPPAAIATAVANATFPPLPPPVAVRHEGCRKFGMPCWLAGALIGGGAAAVICVATHSKSQPMVRKQENIPETQFKETGPVGTPRPLTAPTLNLAAPTKGFSLSVKF